MRDDTPGTNILMSGFPDGMDILVLRAIRVHLPQLSKVGMMDLNRVQILLPFKPVL